MFEKILNKMIKVDRTNDFTVLNRLYDLGFRWETDNHILPEFIKDETSRIGIDVFIHPEIKNGKLILRFSTNNIHYKPLYDLEKFTYDDLFTVNENGIFHEHGRDYDYSHFFMGDKYLTIIQEQGTGDKHWFFSQIIDLTEDKYQVAYSVLKIELEREIKLRFAK